MALGKYSRVDGRKSSSGYCSTVSIVVVVALCLVGVWMMTSSSAVPAQNSDVSQENSNGLKAHVTESNDQNNNDSNNESNNGAVDDKHSSEEGNSKQFEDNPGDLPEDATKGDNNVNPNQEEKNERSEDVEKITEEKQEEKLEEKSEDENKENGDERKEDTPTNESENGDEKKEDEESTVVKNDSESGETNENNSDDNEKTSEESSGEKDGEKEEGKVVENKKDEESDQGSTEKKENSSEVFPSGAQSDLLSESTTQNGGFSTQATESKKEKEAQKSSLAENQNGHSWKLCNTSAGPDYIPCLDNLAAIRKLTSTKHFEHRERHCPENPPTCLVPLPEGYQHPIEWPTSREKV